MKQPRFHLECRKNEIWYVYWYERRPDGRRIKMRRSLFTSNKLKAKFELEKFIKNFSGDAPDLSAYEIEAAFNKSLTSQGLDHKTIYKYQQHTKEFADFICKKVIAVRNIRQDHILDFLKHLSERGLSESTISGYKRTLKKLFLDLENRDFITKNPLRRIPIGKMVKRTRFLSQEEIRKLLEVTEGKDYDRALVLFLLQTGFRIQEVCDSCWEKVFPERQTILVTGKFKKARIQRIPNPAFQAINKIRKPDDVTIFGRSQKTIYRYVQEILKRAAVKAMTHDFRRTYGTYSTALGIPWSTIMDRMGHANPMQLRDYSQALNQKIDEDIRILFADWEIKESV